MKIEIIRKELVIEPESFTELYAIEHYLNVHNLKDIIKIERDMNFLQEELPL